MYSHRLCLITTTLIFTLTLASCNLPSTAGPASTPIIMDWPDSYLTAAPTTAPT